MPEFPYSNQQSTSIAARESIAPCKNALQVKVLRAIKLAGPRGCTDQELQVALSMCESTERPRRKELQLAGLIVDSGNTRRTRSHRWAIVWVAKPENGKLFR